MIVVADAGPLMALAKVDGLDALARLYPSVHTPQAVYEEAVTAGLRLDAPDAAALASAYEQGRLVVVPPRSIGSIVPTFLGRGEHESISLAIELRADWLLVDDLDARRSAVQSLRAAGVETGIKGTLGVIVSAHLERHLSRAEAVAMLEAMRARPDIWIADSLLRRVLELLHASP